MIVQKDIAAKLGISRSAVSAILQGGERAEKFRPEMRQRVLEAASHYGYQRNELAHAVRSGRTYTLGFLTQNVIHPHVGILLNGVLDVAQRSNYSIRIFNTDNEDSADAIGHQILGQCLAGVIVYDISRPDFLTTLYSLLQHNGIPMVYAGGSSPLREGMRIESDLDQGGQLAFQHLYDLGHRRFLVATSYGWADYSKKLVHGFQKAAEQAPGEIQCLHMVAENDLDCHQAIGIIQEKNITACFCTTSNLAMKMQCELQRQGIHVPEQVSIMGRGNMDYCRFITPELTVLDERLGEIGQQAAETLLRTLQGKDGKQPRTIPPIPHQLAKRASTDRAIS